jgi:3-mercaptopyruvate sulfurtransferase SseA
LARIKWVLAIAALLASCTAWAGTRWSRVLAAHVRDGSVDYAGLRADRSDLDAFLSEVARGAPRFVDEADRIGFFIDVYNACAMAMVRDRAVRSIQDVGDPFSRPSCVVAGRRRSLDDIESQELRATGDARVHAALVCASRGCPPLDPRPFHVRDLDARLDGAARAWLARSTVARVDPAERAIYVSHIFAPDWLGGDFARQAGSVPAWLRRHGPPALASALDSGFALRFLEWDWSLNDVNPAPPIGFIAPARAKQLLGEGKVVVLDARSSGFSDGHLPGAQPVAWARLLGAPDEQVASELARLGVDDDRPVLVYGDAAAGEGAEGWVAWRLITLGHLRVDLLDGGWPAWQRAAGPDERGAARPPKVGRFHARPDARERANSASAKEAVLLDVRSAAEWHDTPTPGARHIAWNDLLADGSMPLVADLEARLAKAGLRRSHDLVTVCTGGVRSAFAWAILRSAGYRVRNFEF